MSSWDDLRVFLALARQGSLARAARSLGVDATTVGRRIAALEQAFDTSLFDRTPSGPTPTAAGRALLSHAEQMEALAVAAQTELGSRDRRLEGSVVVTAGDGIATYLLAPWLVEFRRRHPGVTLDLRSDNRALDLARREADVAVRLFRPKQPALLVRKAGTLPFGIYAAASYFERKGRPRDKRDLAAHDWLAWGLELESSAQSRWLARHAPESRVVLRANTTSALVSACAAGHGLAVLPKFAAAREHDLLLVLPRSAPPPREVFLVTHPGARNNARVQALTTFLADRFA